MIRAPSSGLPRHAAAGLRKGGRISAQSYVLVHGAFHGGWCYRDVARSLRAAGHEVFTPTLTGLGERSHSRSHPINLETHVQDIVNVLLWEDLHSVVLVGHSYGGMVITGVADRLAERMSALVYLDAFVPEGNHDSLFSLAGPSVIETFKGASADGRSIAPISAEAFGVVEAKRAWVDEKCVGHPVSTTLQALELSGRYLTVPNKHYVLATGWGDAPFRRYWERFSKDDSWHVHQMPCGHDVMIDMPEEIAGLLATLA
jgi:pimeloyl-ACP methyl ester carboxylesterase